MKYRPGLDSFVVALPLTPGDICLGYKRTEKASCSVPQSISCAVHSTSFEDAIRDAVQMGGENDTIAAMAGGVEKAIHGSLDAMTA